MIKTYRQGELKSGFVGIRVSVMVEGKAKQKYFSFKASNKKEEQLLSEAKSLQARWLMEKNLAKSKREVASKELRRVSSPFSTGTKGIKFRISHNTCYFCVQGVTDQKRFIRHFSINKLGYDLAWFKACEYLQKNKNYTLLDNVYKNKPAIERLLIAFRYLYFYQNSDVNFKALTSVIDTPILILWFEQLLLQFPKNKAFKAELIDYLSDNNIKDTSLFNLL